MTKICKSVLAASVAVAVSTSAMAADKVPTLGEVLKASGVEVTGYIDTAYNYLSTDQGSNTFRAYDAERNSFNLHALDVSFSALPEKGFGGFAQLQFGQDADFNGAVGTDKNDKVDFQEAYFQYAMAPFTVIAGKFATLAGAEVPEAPANTNYSRSLLYTNAIPVTHTGLRAAFALTDAVKLTAGINNGWDILRESDTNNGPAGNNADGKTIELGGSATLSKLVTLAASYYTGDEYSAISGAVGNRSLLDVVLTLNLSDAMSVVVNLDRAEQERATAAGGTAKWDGIAGYFNYKLNDTWRVSLRGEEFNDKNCFRTTTTGTCVGGATSQKIKEVTATVGFAAAKNVELRGEVRKDDSNVRSFTEDGSPTDNQTSFGIQGIYKF